MNLTRAIWCWVSRFLPSTKHDIQKNRKIIIMKLNELANAIATVNTTLEKVATEIQALKDSLTNVDLPADAQAALDKLVATASALDALNDDAPAA